MSVARCQAVQVLGGQVTRLQDVRHGATDVARLQADFDEADTGQTWKK